MSCEQKVGSKEILSAVPTQAKVKGLSINKYLN